MSVTAFEVAPYGGIDQLLNHTTSRFALIREDLTVIGDLSKEEVQLFAAAPDLLQSLKNLRATFGPAMTAEHGTDYLLLSVDKAIAKAEGRTP